jgi:hypothetical protein
MTPYGQNLQSSKAFAVGPIKLEMSIQVTASEGGKLSRCKSSNGEKRDRSNFLGFLIPWAEPSLNINVQIPGVLAVGCLP